MKRLLAVAAMIGFSLIALTGSAQAAMSVKFVSPTADQLVTAPTTKVEVRTSKPTAKMHIEVRGRAIGWIKRLSSTRWTATLKRSQLVPGGNDLTASARTGDERGFAVIRITKGRSNPKLLGLTVPSSGPGPTAARIKLATNPDLLLRARLNGKPATNAFQPTSRTVRQAGLSPNDGLRYGKNRLQVRAARSNGDFDNENKSFRVSRTRPLAAAGKDRLVHAGRKLRLSGKASRRSVKGAKLTYSWKVVGRPKGSKPKISNSKRVRPTLRMNQPGTYRVRLTVRQRGPLGKTLRKRVGQDTITVTNAISPTPLGIPINTQANPGGNNPGMSYNGTYYPADFETVTAQMMIIDRVTGAVLSQQNYAGTSSDATAATNAINAVAAQEPLVILNSSGLGADNIDPSFNNVVKVITGSSFPSSLFGQDGFSVIGIPGTPGAAWMNVGLSGLNLNDLSQISGGFNGYLQEDTTGHLAFTPKARVELDASAPGTIAGQNTIQVGDDLYPSGPLESPTNPGTPCGTGGFQVQAVTAEFLDAGPGQTFTTNGCDSVDDPEGQHQMAEFLKSGNLFNEQGAQLVIIQSIGDPRGPNDDNWDELTQAIVGLGGTPYLFDFPANAGTSYGIVAISSRSSAAVPDFPVFEASSEDTGQPIHMTAILKQSRNGYMAPQQASASNRSFDFDLSLLAYEPETGPAFPNASTPEEMTALQYIADEVLDLPEPQAGTSCYVPATPDVRSEYCNPDVTDRWGSNDEDGFTYRLTNATYPGANAGFSEETWNALRCDFLGTGCATPNTGDEWGQIQQIWSDFSILKQFILANSSVALADANLTAQNIRTSLSIVSPSFEVRWMDMFGNILTGVTYLGIKGLGDPVGLMSTAALLAEDALNSPQGNPLLGEFNTTASVYVADLAAAFTGSFTALDHTRNIILTSSDKMQKMANGDYVPGNLSQSIPAITLGVARFSYESLLPAAYEPVQLVREGVNDGVTNVTQYECGAADIGVGYNPFRDEPASAQWAQPGGHLYAMVKKGVPLPNGESRLYPDTPSAALFDPLFKPYATDGTNVIPTQFNFNPDTFFTDVWDLPKVRVVNC